MNKKKKTSVFVDDRESKFINQQSENIKTDLITITEDKLENILLKYIRCLSLPKAWVAPLTLTGGFLTTLLTAEFQGVYGLTSDQWEMLIIIGVIFSSIWFIFTIVNLISNQKSATIESLIERIKNVDEKKGNSD